MKLVIIPSWYPSELNPADGAFFKDWARALTEAGHDVIVVVNILHSLKRILNWYRLPGPSNEPVLEFGMRTYRREAINPFPKQPRRAFQHYQRSLLAQFKRVLQQESPPDVALIHSAIWAGAALAQFLANRSIPFILAEHIKDFLEPDGFTSFQRECIDTTFQSASRIVAVSSVLERQIVAAFPGARGRTVVIPNPVGPHFLRPAEEARPPETDFNFIAVSYFRPEKHLDLLLSAFARLVREGRSVRLRLVGDGPQRKTLERQARRLNLMERVEFVGYLPREQVPPQLRGRHCLILPSRVETFGLVLVEAMACGLPVIATRSGGPEDIVTPETGLLVPVGDENALHQAMQTMMDEYGQYNPAAIRGYALERFSPQAYVQAYNALFEEVVSVSAAPPE